MLSVKCTAEVFLLHVVQMVASNKLPEHFCCVAYLKNNDVGYVLLPP